MMTTRNWKKTAGWILHALIAAILLPAGAGNLFGLMAAEEVAKMGLNGWIEVIGVGAVISAILLVVPRTVSLGVLLTTSFWAGTISFHMSRGEPFVFQAVLLLATWAGAYLRVPAMFGSFYPRSGSRTASTQTAEAAAI
jgi:hypothetical protein